MQPGSDFDGFDFLADLDRNEPAHDKNNSFFSGGDGKNELKIDDFLDFNPIEVERREHTISDIYRFEKPDSNIQE